MKDEDKSKAQLISEIQTLRKQLEAPPPATDTSFAASTAAACHNEALFRSLVESMPQNVFSKDLQGRFIFANQRYCDTEKKSLTEILGKTDFDMHPPELAQKYQQDDLAVIQSGKTINQVEEHQSIGNDSFFVQVIKTPVYDSSGRVAGMLGMFWDVTEIKKMEEERAKLEKLEAVGILAGGIAHDFNNLLTGLFGNLELAKIHLTTDHNSYKFIQSASRCMGQLVNLTNQLLTFSKGGEPAKENLLIGDLLVETAEFSIHGSNVKLQCNIDKNLLPVSADRGQLSQVIGNLVINAQQAMPDGGIITIAAENVKGQTGQYISIQVKDQGIGITQAHIDKIFDPYFTTKQKGSGLGLASCHSIIKKHNGRIEVTSSPNQGTCFTIFLPAAKPNSQLSSDTQATENALFAQVKSAKILVMDDELEIVKMLAETLTASGHRVTLTTTGEDAVEQYQKSQRTSEPFDVVILDLTIPGGMGGKEVAQEILRMDKDAKLIVSSGYASEDIMSQYKRYGFRARIPKPYHLHELEEVIHQVLLNEPCQSE